MKPINMKTWEVQALFDNRKTVARRVMKPQPVWSSCGMRWSWKNAGWWRDGWNPIETITLKNTRYRPGDILYVRETWTVWNGNYEYKADVDDGYGPFCSSCTLDICAGDCNSALKWRPSIHMPREAARIFLRVTDVRVDRLQDMNMNDIQSEGVVPDGVKGGQWQQWQHDYMKPAWDSTIKPKDRALYGWEANPWVWVVEFDRISKEEAENEP